MKTSPVTLLMFALLGFPVAAWSQVAPALSEGNPTQPEQPKLITKEWKVFPGFLRYAEGIPEASNPLAEKSLREGDASWTYQAAGSRLIVRNTPERIKQVDALVQRIGWMQRRGAPPPPICDSGIRHMCNYR